MNRTYVHGYDDREYVRLQDQASTLSELLHSDTRYSAGSHVLEVGCGVGAQTLILAKNSPDALITAIDISAVSVAEAKRRVQAAGFTNVRFEQADIFELPFQRECFEHVFVCFVLEHLSRPAEALRALKAYLKPGGTITAIEGDHGSAYFHPDSEAARRAIQCQVELQRRAGGNAMIGRQLYPLLRSAGYESIRVSPRMVYVDASRPELVEGFTKRTFTSMVEGVRETAVEAGIVQRQVIEKGIQDLYRTAEADGVFCYTFFKGTGRKWLPRARGSQADVLLDTKMTICVEPIGECHIDGYHQAVDLVAREGRYLARTEAPSIEDARTFTAENMAKANAHYVAVDKGKVVGWCDIVPSKRQVSAHCGTLGMGLIREYRGLGIGLRLLRAALHKAKQNGLERVELEVFESNRRALSLYEKTGFRVEGKKQRAARLAGIDHDIVLMALFLEEYDS